MLPMHWELLFLSGCDKECFKQINGKELIIEYIRNMKYKHVFFDLDRTLWDFDKSSAEAFSEIYDSYNLKGMGIESNAILYDVYTVHNNRMWEQYRNGKISKEELRGKRFYMTLKDFGIDNARLAENMGDDYIRLSPLKVNLFPQAINILEYLYPKYKLHIITNGFQEVQDIKIAASDLGKYFDTIVTSEEAGVKKPGSGIFEYALKKAGADVAESLMVGDDPDVDITGAKNAGMDQVLFDPNSNYIVNSATYYVVCLDEMKTFL
jgi:putative hydrolase of the HAD superfamily